MDDNVVMGLLMESCGDLLTQCGLGAVENKKKKKRKRVKEEYTDLSFLEPVDEADLKKYPLDLGDMGDVEKCQASCEKAGLSQEDITRLDEEFNKELESPCSISGEGGYDEIFIQELDYALHGVELDMDMVNAIENK